MFVCLESEKGKYAQKLEHNINSVKSQIHEYEQSIINRMDELQVYQRELTGYLTAPFVIDPDLRNFLEKSQSIKILAIIDNNYGAKVQFTTPVMNWNKKDVEMYFKHTALEHETFFNNPFWFGEIIQKIFIEEEYRLLCTTVVNMPIIHRSNNDRWSTDSSPEGTYGNPHFTEYNCYESSRDAYAKAITSNDYTRGFSIILAATATLVFTDSSVMRRMSGHLKEGGTAYNKKIIQHVASGEIFSMKELREKYSKTTEPTETPVEPEVPTAEPRLIF
jgi:hypothetical protein